MEEKRLPQGIRDALKTGDIAELKRLYSGCEANALSEWGSNIFSLSPMPREFAFWAKERGADINFRNRYGKTPIFDIVRMDGDVGLLIELGADIEAAGKDGCTPLHAAAARGRKKAVRTLLKAGARIEAQTKGYNGYGHFTPLEKVLYEPDLSSIKKYEISKFLLDHGAQMTDRSRLFASAFSETFHRHNLGKKVSKSLQNQEEALKKLCGLFDAPMRRESAFHDGVSPIIVTNVNGFKNNFQELWNFLVPPRGRAQTAQGEVIRIAGRVQDELMRNGGLNWDEDYRNMLCTFREYLCPGNPSEDAGEYEEEYIADAFVEEIIAALWDGDVNDGMIWRLCYCARHWVQENPEVMPVLEGNYTR